ncbi:UQCRC1 isoform 6 [Pan troglodytes]|uniref:UQCRC1 isoform 6 n=1 Tax=Pan troglodytes TaxID=9598 RepID=A0A2J8P9W2_PANTR|nr:UQCRC1 isoform 6 [Pan troglodytes]
MAASVVCRAATAGAQVLLRARRSVRWECGLMLAAVLRLRRIMGRATFWSIWLSREQRIGLAVPWRRRWRAWGPILMPTAPGSTQLTTSRRCPRICRKLWSSWVTLCRTVVWKTHRLRRNVM